MKIDLHVAQLLCSKLCHDLIGPAGAVNAGIELLSEDGEMAADALDLVARSGQQMTRRIAFYRVAFGFSGLAEDGLTEARNLTANLLADGTIELAWPAAASDGTQVSATGAKLLLNLVLLAAEAMQRGGRLEVVAAVLDDGVGLALTATGEGVSMRDDVRAAFDSDAAADSLSARTVHAYFARRLALEAAASIEISDTADELRLAAVLPLAT